MTDWVQGQGCEDSVISTFLQKADYNLVSLARAGGHRVVTHEVPAASPRKIKIPDVCIGLKAEHMKPFGILRCVQARLVLGEMV